MKQTTCKGFLPSTTIARETLSEKQYRGLQWEQREPVLRIERETIIEIVEKEFSTFLRFFWTSDPFVRRHSHLDFVPKSQILSTTHQPTSPKNYCPESRVYKSSSWHHQNLRHSDQNVKLLTLKSVQPETLTQHLLKKVHYPRMSADVELPLLHHRPVL